MNNIIKSKKAKQIGGAILVCGLTVGAFALGERCGSLDATNALIRVTDHILQHMRDTGSGVAVTMDGVNYMLKLIKENG